MFKASRNKTGRYFKIMIRTIFLRYRRCRCHGNNIISPVGATVHFVKDEKENGFPVFHRPSEKHQNVLLVDLAKFYKTLKTTNPATTLELCDIPRIGE